MLGQCPINLGDWRKVKAEIDTKIGKHRDRLEGRTVDPIETAFLRGRIAALRDLIAWGEPTPNTLGGDY